MLRIVRESGIRGEIYHLKAAGEENWPKLDDVITKIIEAREAGLQVSANMYPYTAAQASLGATMPPWVQEGGHDAWIERLKDPDTRARVVEQMNAPSGDWENFLSLSGSPKRVVPVGFRTDALKHLSGMTLAEIAKERGTSPADTIIDLTIEDNSRIQCMYHVMSEENVRKKLRLKWVSIGSDAASMSKDSAWAKNHTHPRAYGTFARVLGHYARDERIMKPWEAVRRMTSLPAENLRLDKRGRIAPGWFADIVVLNLDEVDDVATYQDPHRYAEGVEHVFVNGGHVLANGEPTGRSSGRVLRREM
jgi:N-acyl-D-amino-acid deacylase